MTPIRLQARQNKQFARKKFAPARSSDEQLGINEVISLFSGKSWSVRHAN
jgi:hypothetical protein